MIEKFIKDIEILGYKVSHEKNSVFIWHEDAGMGWRAKIIKEDNYYYVYLYYRTESCFFNGDRTDLHEIIPVFTTLYSRIHNLISFRLVGEKNEFSGINSELYGMYLLPSQPISEKIRLDNSSDFDIFFEFFFLIYALHNSMYEILDLDRELEEIFSFEDVSLDNWKENILTIIPDKNIIYNLRKNPNWFYFRSYKHRISVVKCESLVRNIRNQSKKIKQKVISGVDGDLYISENIKNTISYDNIKLATNVLHSVEDCENNLIIVQENFSVIIGYYNLVIFSNDGDVENYNKEKSKIMERHADESLYLFNDKKIIWNIENKKHSAIFEDLILELLSREPEILSVKKVAPTFQGDNGRDLICIYNMNHSLDHIDKGRDIIKEGSLIIQCKTNLKTSKKQSIGKADVDIANTIYDYKPDGYLLVVNTQTTRGLTEYLEKIKYRQELHKIDWWNSFDIEEKLRINPDIMNRFKEIVNYENT